MKSSTTSFSLVHSLLFYGILSFVSWMAVKSFILSAAIILLPLLFYRISILENKKRQIEALKAKEKLHMDALAIQISKKLDKQRANLRVTQH